MYNSENDKGIEVDEFWNWDTQNVATPVNEECLQHLLWESHYDLEETEFLIQGFSKRFSIEYSGPHNRKNKSRNIPFCNGVGS